MISVVEADADDLLGPRAAEELAPHRLELRERSQRTHLAEGSGRHQPRILDLRRRAGGSAAAVLLTLSQNDNSPRGMA
jgi:hypothetical protein